MFTHRTIALFITLISCAYAHSAPFKAFVERYAKKTNEDVEKNLSSHISQEKELTYIIQTVQTCSDVQQCIALLDCIDKFAKQRVDLLQDKKNAIKKRTPLEKDEAYQKVACAVFLKCALILSEVTRIQLLRALHIIDTYLFYWREQKNKQIYYFFHKSPLKWFTGKNQNVEIDTNIELLERIQAELFTCLGSLVAHLYTYNSQASFQEQYRWINALLSLIPSKHYHNCDNTVDITCQADLLKRLRHTLVHASKIKDNILLLVDQAKKPHYLVRNWVFYSTIAATIGYAMYYGHTNPDIVESFIGQAARDQYMKSIKEQFDIVTPVKNIWNILAGKDDANEEEMKKLQDINTNIGIQAEKIREFIPKLASNNAKDIQKQKEILTKSALEAIKNHLDVLVKANKIPADQKEKIIETLSSQEGFDLFLSLCDRLKISGYWNLPQDLDHILQSWFLAGQLVTADTLHSVEGYADYIDSKIVPLIQEIAEVTADAADLVKSGSEDYYAIKKQTRLTAQLLFLMPVGFIAWGLGKLYTTLRQQDYAPLRTALAEVQSFFIESQPVLHAQEYGKLIYLLYKLKNKALDTISNKDPLQRDFLHDIEKLESKEFTIDTKRHIIDNMRAQYPFLSLTA